MTKLWQSCFFDENDYNPRIIGTVEILIDENSEFMFWGLRNSMEILDCKDWPLLFLLAVLCVSTIVVPCEQEPETLKKAL